MKKSKKNYAIIVLIVLLLALAVGYAAFSTALTINGTVTGATDWEVKFTTASINPTPADVTRTAVVTNDTTITVNAELCYPGDGCEVHATILNNGNLDAKLTQFEIASGADFDVDNDGTDDVIVTLPTTVKTDGSEVIEAHDTCEVVFTIQWNEESEVEDLGTIQFAINFNYEQNDLPVNVSTNHIH